MIHPDTPYFETFKLPSEGLTPPWDTAVQAMQRFCYPTVIKNREAYLVTLDDVRQGLFALKEFEWQLKAHWVYKLGWNTRHKVPYRQGPKTQKAFRIEAEWLCAIRDLCTGCHGALQPKSTPYGNAGQWFSCTFNELKSFDFEAITTKTIGTPGHVAIKEQREILKYLRQAVNPFCVEDCPHFWLLIEKSLMLSEEFRGSVFAKKYWKPFLASYASWIREQERNPEFKSVLIKDGIAYYREGHGKEIFPLSQKQPLIF